MSNPLAPHIRTEQRSYQMLLDVLLVCCLLCAYSVVSYGPRPATILLLSVVTAVVGEWFCCVFQKKNGKAAFDGSAAVTGAIIALAMPPAVSYWVPMVAAAFAIIVAKAPFGGYGRNIFNPAAAGIAVVSYCFPKRVFAYTAATAVTKLPLSWGIDPVLLLTESSLAAQLRAGATPATTRMQLLLGDFPGPIGATATLILLAAIAYLLFRRTVHPSLVFSYLGTCLVCAWLFPFPGTGRLYGTMAQMCAGYVLFTGVLLLNDPVTTPRFWLGRLFYGIGAGFLVMLLQHVGRVEAGSCFAILLMNVLSPIIDRWSWHLWRRLRRLFRIRQEVNNR